MLLAAQSRDNLHALHHSMYARTLPHAPNSQNTLSPATHAQPMQLVLRFAAQAQTIAVYAPLCCTLAAFLYTLRVAAHAPGELQKSENVSPLLPMGIFLWYVSQTAP